MITFILGVGIARNIGPQVYANASVHLYLIFSIIVFLAREPIRYAAPRFAGAEAERAVVRVFWKYCFPYGVIVAGIAWKIGISYAEGADRFEEAIGVCVIAALVELVAEPMFIVLIMRVQIKEKVKAEALGIFVRCLFTYYFVIHLDLGIIGFGWGYLLSSIFLVFVLVFMKSRLKEDKSENVSNPEPEILKLTLNFWFQSLEKFLLTEGEKMAIVALDTDLKESGVYGLVCNLGSLVARLLFQPIEELSAAEFKKLYGDSKSSKESRMRSKEILVAMIKLVLLLGLLTITFGPPYSYSLIYIIYGNKWANTTAPVVLSAYCVYILFMALNGVSEAFVTSTMDQHALKRYNFMLLIFSSVYLLSIFATSRFDLIPGIAFIISNSINMLTRIIYNINYISKKFENYSIFGFFKDCLPRKSLLLLFLCISIAGNISSAKFISSSSTPSISSLSLHCATGIFLLVVFSLSFIRLERSLIQSISQLKHHNKSE
jgi:oligosaccharide translocation protein RFT1